jgi:autotransporter-associated beta strand protein
MELMVGRRSSGVLTISGNALLDLYSLKLGESTNYTTIVNLDGGVIACTHIASRATNSVQTTSILNLNGGTVRAKGVAGGLIGGYGSGTISYLTTVNVKSGGAIIDSQSYSVTIPQVLGHDPALGATLDGGLTKRGTGVLTLTTTNTYTGVTSVEAGKLKLGVANTLSASVSVLVASNAVFDVDGKAQTLAGLGGSGLVTNNSLLTVTFGIAPGGTNAIGQLTLASAPAALGGVFLADVATNGVCDRLYVQGDLDLSGLVLSVANAESLDKAQRYVVAKYKGALTGPFNSAVLPQRWNVKYDEAAREVYLHYDFGTLLLLH